MNFQVLFGIVVGLFISVLLMPQSVLAHWEM